MARRSLCPHTVDTKRAAQGPCLQRRPRHQQSGQSWPCVAPRGVRRLSRHTQEARKGTGLFPEQRAPLWCCSPFTRAKSARPRHPPGAPNQDRSHKAGPRVRARLGADSHAPRPHHEDREKLTAPRRPALSPRPLCASPPPRKSTSLYLSAGAKLEAAIRF